MNQDPNQLIDLSTDEKNSVIQRKATCPFIGSAVSEGDLPMRNDAANPLASIEDVRRLGNTGGGDLGDLLVFFATGNHAFMRGPSGSLDTAVPSGLFSLEFPGSQGSHPGHSGILQGDPQQLDSGRFSEADFERLVSHATNGLIKRADVGRFIAENLRRDPNSKVLDHRTLALLASDSLAALETSLAAIGKLLGGHDEVSAIHRDIEEKLTKLLGEDNLVGSAGEFGLLFAFFANKPDAQHVDGEPAIAIDDLKTMFVDKRLPEGWQTWRKLRVDWVKNTTGLLIAAAKEYRTLKAAQ
ncbi:MAG TPA: hypothetical protein VNG94_07775 [Pyrinomonadaceae bacterium]|nr:hypothetical protein [Pyrinomonadaceae bacterium]